MPEESPYQARLARVRAAANPVLEAAMPLLRALSDMPSQLEPEAAFLLRRLLDREVLRFQSLCTDAAIRHEHGVAASYALCTALDEAAASTPWGGGRQSDVGVWSGDQLAVRFHGDNKGGDKFFLLLGRLAASPETHIDLIELLSTILGLGFEGRYGSGNGVDARRQLDSVRHRLYLLLTSARAEVPLPLSPQAFRMPGGTSDHRASRRFFRPLYTVPLPWACVMYALVLLGSFGIFKLQLDHRSAVVLSEIRAIGELQAPAGTPAADRRVRLGFLLHDEIAQGLVTVDEDEAHSAVSFRGDDMFIAGQARLQSRMLPLLARIAEQVAEVPGTLRIVGHSDNQPIHTPQFPDNLVLSRARAQAVADALVAAGVDAARLEVSGAGDRKAVGDNHSPSGRARNRRVEIELVPSLVPSPAPTPRP